LITIADRIFPDRIVRCPIARFALRSTVRLLNPAGDSKRYSGAGASICAELPVAENNSGETMSADGLTTLRSRHGPEETMNRFEAEVRANGLTVFAHIDHAAGATAAGLALRPTELLIFGNARAGTPLMQANQMIGIDLPLKVLVWQDAAGDTWLSYNDPAGFAQRHGLGPDGDGAIAAMKALLQTLAATATGP
jgi:uncharacterized protein (DUF302 family)